MIDFIQAQKAFQNYISSYNMTIPSIRLKVVHTYKVVECCEYLCQHLHLSKEDTDLAMLIALLHDIGRFEQWMQYQSFADHKTIDHALFSSQLLFGKGLIREFISDSQYDDIIKNAIEQHNRYRIEDGFDERTLLFIHLIRDGDKLDNFRVKEEERIEDLLYASLEQVNQESISDKIYQQFLHEQLIYAPDRQTHIDMWLSYIAFIFDLYYPCSVQYIQEYHWVERSFDRLSPVNPHVYQQYMTLKQIALDYIQKRSNNVV